MAFQRPHEFAWGFWNTQPVFQMSVLIAIISNFLHGQLRPRLTPLLSIYLVFLLWITLSCVFAYDTTHAWATYKYFLPSMWVTPVLVFATIHDLRLWKWVMWAAAGGIGLNAFKVGLVMTARGGGHLTDQISGFVGDNNVFGLVLCLVVSVLMGLRRTLPQRRVVLAFFYFALFCIVMCVIYTKSRGALLTLVIIMVAGSLLSGKPLRSALIATVVISSFAWFVPEHYFERLSTLESLDQDESFAGRIENWMLAWRAALDNPLFGVGLDNHLAYYRAIQPGVQVRVAHSVYFQVLGELGFPGLMLYLCFSGLGLVTLFKTWRALVPIAAAHSELAWTRDLAFWMTCGYFGYIFGAGFLNMLYIEFPWYVVFYGSMLWSLVDKDKLHKKPIDTQ